MGIEKLVSQLIRASLDNNSREVRAISMRIIRKIKDDHPKIADEIASALAEHSIGASTQRSIGISPTPQDSESMKDLVLIEEFIDLEKPIFSENIAEQLETFIKEREQSEKLMQVGLTPPSSLLLHGPPGVGKTQIAKYLSNRFELSLITLDLSSVISSYLGKTGQNLKKVLDYVKNQPSILLLDEFDAVAKRRDDMSDLGELKRIVNVLLKELENWPSHTILIAATNHPNLLDPAIWRRFDRDIEITLPGPKERKLMLESEFNDVAENLKEIISLLVQFTDGLSGADIKKLSDRTKRRVILHDVDYAEAIIQELLQFKNDGSIEFNKKFAKLAHEQVRIPIRTIAKWLGKSSSAVQYYLKK
ncbi:AAA family ATPase [Lysinibacillus sp. C5.1]|uniref:AAA family ATPase n=1 Tax=Lysinibacillus sp. C5.1 TaxID=2796169 RepID=UPI00308213B1